MDSIKKYLSIVPRDYQIQIYNTCKEKNCLVVLPTGLGKTLIALMLTINRMIKFPQSKILFLAPTKPLAEQHLKYYEKNLPELFASFQLFTGKTNANERKKLFQVSDIIFSTPQCIENDIKHNLYSLEDISLLIVDECHRCLKNYSYTKIAKDYNKYSKNPLILGLTASPGHEKEKVDQICNNLNIQKIEIRTRDSEGVSEYLQDLDFETIKLDFPPEFLEIKILLKQILDSKIEELKSRKLLFGIATKTNLLITQKKIMKAITSGNKHFNLLVGASITASALKVSHALELLETQTLASFYKYLTDLLEKAKKGESKAVQNLVKHPEFTLAYTKTLELISKKVEHPKLKKLSEIVEQNISNSKLIVFAQFRETVSTITNNLNMIPGVKAKTFIGQAKKENVGLSQKDQQKIINEFSSGEINVLVATQIAEEGLDIPEVNAVIFYEPIPSAIRMIQRRGRTARLIPGKLIILITKKTRDESYYYTAVSKEKKMYSLLNNMQKDFTDKPTTLEDFG